MSRGAAASAADALGASAGDGKPAADFSPFGDGDGDSTAFSAGTDENLAAATDDVAGRSRVFVVQLPQYTPPHLDTRGCV